MSCLIRPLLSLALLPHQNVQATGLRSRLAGIDIEGTIATARLELDD
jgi:hypothetical protein